MGHHSTFSFNPASSFGVIVLMTGSYGDTEKVVIEAFKHFQPAFDLLQVNATKNAYAGTWTSDDGDSTAVVSVVDGSMWMETFTLKGHDVLAVLRNGKPEKLALASTGREREFRYVNERAPVFQENQYQEPINRLAIGYQPLTSRRHYGCMPYWGHERPWPFSWCANRHHLFL
jgi:hypothetical protein